MCVNYLPSRREELTDYFGAAVPDGASWPAEVWQDYAAPIIRANANGQREAAVASFGMVPRRHVPEGVKPWASLNCRTESIGQKRTFSPFWRRHQFALAPMTGYYEPSWQTGKAVRWRIGLASGEPFAVAALWRSWSEPDGKESLSFSLLTVNCNEHPLLNQFHRPAPPNVPEDKRSLVIVQPSEWDAWLSCTDTELARSFFGVLPAELLAAQPAPKGRAA